MRFSVICVLVLATLCFANGGIITDVRDPIYQNVPGIEELLALAEPPLDPNANVYHLLYRNDDTRALWAGGQIGGVNANIQAPLPPVLSKEEQEEVDHLLTLAVKPIDPLANVYHLLY